MPQFPETRFYRRVNARVPRIVHRQKIGSAAENGTADFWYSGFRADLWVEYKWIPYLSPKGTQPLKLLSPLQARWLTMRAREGRNVCTIIGSPDGVAILQHGTWNEPQLPAAFGYSEAEVALWLTEYLHADSSEIPATRVQGPDDGHDDC